MEDPVKGTLNRWSRVIADKRMDMLTTAELDGMPNGPRADCFLLALADLERAAIHLRMAAREAE